jgi:hypothetical protein
VDAGGEEGTVSRSLRVLAILASVLVLLGAAPAAIGGGPTREVISMADPALDAEESASLTEECGFPVRARNAGHIIIQVFPAGSRKMQQLDHYNIRATYTNLETGAYVLLRDIGPDRWYVRDGKAYVAVTGRATTSTGVIGQVVIDLETGETVKSVGNDVGVFWDRLCAALSD